MSSSPLAPGDLVRYQATTTRWHLGIVREVDGEVAEVEFFWGERLSVSLEQIVRFRDYLDTRSRVLSLKRTVLCEVFFGDPLHRMRGQRVRTIQETLRQFGVSFRPERWPTPATRVQIWRDDSVVLADGRGKEAKFEALLPRWLQSLKLPPSSRDPLGLQAHAERLASELLPGLTVFTSRIGYYGFLAWAIQCVNDLSCPDHQTRLERLHRLERALVLCEFVHHGLGDDSCRLFGQRSKTQVLQGAEGDRYRVPKRILKNQASAGAYRLYFTSMQSMGIAQEAPELGAEGLLPLTLTDLGRQLAHAFQFRLDNKFADFVFSDRPLERNTIRSWGKQLCFARLGRLDRYRTPFLEGFLLGNGVEAEKRYRTVQRLFQRELLTGAYEEEAAGPTAAGAVPEEDAMAVEAVPDVAGLGNDRVLLHFYDEAPQADNHDFQLAAVFELLALGLSALFQCVVGELQQSGRVHPAGLAARIAGEGQLNQLWTSPLGAVAGSAPKARTLVPDLLAAEDPLHRAALGGVLLGRVLGDPAQAAVGDELAGNPTLLLTDATLRSRPERSLMEAFPDVVGAMADWHQAVSLNKNRQRWCYLDGNVVVKDDLQEMQVGFHAFRFPQLFSLCWDLGLQAEDLRHGI